MLLVSKTVGFCELLLAIPSPWYRERAEGARYEPAGERVNPVSRHRPATGRPRKRRYGKPLSLRGKPALLLSRGAVQQCGRTFHPHSSLAVGLRWRSAHRTPQAESDP